MTAPGRTLQFDASTFRFSVLDKSGAEREGLVLERPCEGYGGHEVVSSPDGEYAALYLYSGESEQGWELFRLTPKLCRLQGLPYVFGSGDPPLFSPGSEYLVMPSTGEMRFIDGQGSAFDEVEFDELDASQRSEREWTVEWAQLHVQTIATGAVIRHALRAEFPKSAWKEDPLEWEWPTDLAFVAPDQLQMTPAMEREGHDSHPANPTHCLRAKAREEEDPDSEEEDFDRGCAAQEAMSLRSEPPSATNGRRVAAGWVYLVAPAPKPDEDAPEGIVKTVFRLAKQ